MEESALEAHASALRWNFYANLIEMLPFLLNLFNRILRALRVVPFSSFIATEAIVKFMISQVKSNAIKTSNMLVIFNRLKQNVIDCEITKISMHADISTDQFYGKRDIHCYLSKQSH